MNSTVLIGDLGDEDSSGFLILLIFFGNRLKGFHIKDVQHPVCTADWMLLCDYGRVTCNMPGWVQQIHLMQS